MSNALSFAAKDGIWKQSGLSSMGTVGLKCSQPRPVSLFKYLNNKSKLRNLGDFEILLKRASEVIIDL